MTTIDLRSIDPVEKTITGTFLLEDLMAPAIRKICIKLDVPHGDVKNDGIKSLLQAAVSGCLSRRKGLRCPVLMAFFVSI